MITNEGYNPVVKVPINNIGVDYIIGDVHGCFEQVCDALEKSNFDTAKDRLFCTGDLIDRGPDSVHIVEFLSNPWVYSVLGNHEYELRESFKADKVDQGRLMHMIQNNGLEWWLKTTDETKADILAAIRSMPIVIETKNARGSVGIVHADVPEGMAWDDFKRNIEQGNEDIIVTAVWSRKRINNWARDGAVEGVDRVFVGHTPVSCIERIGNVYFVDSGCYYGVQGRSVEGRLSMINIMASTEVLNKRAGADGDRVLVDIVDSPGFEPYGNYGQNAL